MRENHESEEFINELSRSVGRVVMAFSQIEHELTITIARILKLTQMQERALIRPMSIATKATLLRRLAKDFLSKEDYKTVNKIIKSLEDSAETRNDLAHGFYGYKKKKFALLAFSGAARFSGQPIAWTPRRLEVFCVEALPSAPCCAPLALFPQDFATSQNSSAHFSI